MITTAQISAIAEGDLHDADGDKVGAVGRVYLDNRTGEPEWVTVKTGLFGSRSTFVPLAGATVEGDDVHVPWDKATIKDAPKIEDDDELTPEQEDELYAYYGIDGAEVGAPEVTAATTADGPAPTDSTPATPAPADAALSSGTAKLRRYMGEHAAPTTDEDADGGGRHEA